LFTVEHRNDMRGVGDEGRRRSNQLIVGPESWAYQVLRQTFGERFMVQSEGSVFIARYDRSDFRSSLPTHL
jgi:hypothetical protein